MKFLHDNGNLVHTPDKKSNLSTLRLARVSLSSLAQWEKRARHLLGALLTA